MTKVMITYTKAFNNIRFRIFRVVPNQMRSFAVGVQFIFFRLLGAIPGPILFGAIIDKACLQWQTRQCDGSRGSCWIYSSRDMALGFLIISTKNLLFSCYMIAHCAKCGLCTLVSPFFLFLLIFIFSFFEKNRSIIVILMFNW